MEMITNHKSIVTGSSNMYLIFTLCLLGIVSLIDAQTKVKCFDNNKGEDDSGILLDCSNMVSENHPFTINEWIQHHAFVHNSIEANRVLQIKLENNNFQEIFKFPRMSSLKTLSFKNNNISSFEDRALTDLPALEEIDLSFNSLRSHDLQKTVFQNNQSPNAPLIHEESTIKILRLGFNNIHSLSPNCFEYLTRLEVLELNNNPLSVIDQNTEITLGYLINLQVLNLANTGISHIPTNVFTRLKINSLYLNGNKFQKIPKEIRNLPLSYLNMNSNPVNYLDDESFIGLHKLQQLVISGMPKLTSIGSGTFVPLTRLITLHMSYNPSLSHIHCDAFRDGTISNWSLRQLFLSNTNLTSIDSKLYDWTKLDLFDAKSNRWTCDCKLSWLASYINETFFEVPETLLYYRCNEPKILDGTLLSQLNDHIECDEFLQDSANYNNGQVTRLRQFIIVVGLVISIFVFGTLINMGCREIKKVLKPRICVPARFSTGVKYRPADFEDYADTIEAPSKNAMIHGRSPIVINNTTD